MRHPSLRFWLPLIFVAAFTLVSISSVVYSVYRYQVQLENSARDDLLSDVARLVRLADRGWPSNQGLIAADLAQIASATPVVAAVVLDEDGIVLVSHRLAWVGRRLADVLPHVDSARVNKALQTRAPDWIISADGLHLDAVQSFAFMPGADEVRSLRRGYVYVAYDLTLSRQQAIHAELMGRIPDLIGLTVIFIGLVWLLGRYVTGPIGRLDRVAEALSQGRLDVVIPKEGAREVQVLAEGFEELRQDLAATWRAMPDLLFEVDAHGRYMRVMTSRPELLVTSPDQLIGRTVDDVLPPGAAQVVHQTLADAALKGGVWGREVMLEVPAGRMWFELSVARKDRPGAVVPTYLVVSRDITARKRMQETLAQLNEELERRVTDRTTELLRAKNEAERANQAKSDFLSRMSHELRTPLNAIMGFGQLLQLSAREPAQQNYTQQILSGGSHLLTLINEVLDLARVESGQMTVSMEWVNVAELVHECFDLVAPQAKAKSIQIKAESCDGGLFVRADRVRFKQVLLNLLSNAVKFNREGGDVLVRCESSTDQVWLTVSDQGKGLSESDQAKLFVPFERLDADQRQIEGTGIGLALSQRLMQLMGGDIGVRSGAGEGATFWVRLERSEPGLVKVAPAPLPGELHSHDAAACERIVLCIEDNPTNLQLMESVMRMLPGVKLLAAQQPSQGLSLAREHRPDLILLDINLPDMDGFAVMQCLKDDAQTREIPVIAVSANAMAQDLERGRAAGFVDYVTKPIDVNRLIRLVDELTRRE